MVLKSKKQKLTLTIRKDIVERAKERAKEKGVSVSHLFESMLEMDEKNEIKHMKRKKAIEEFLQHMEKAVPTDALPKSDKEIWHKHLDEKYG